MWQPDSSRGVIKREELRQARQHDADASLEHARDLDADEVAARAERRRQEREAVEHGHDEARPGRDHRLDR